jgi:hypothetical protein
MSAVETPPARREAATGYVPHAAAGDGPGGVRRGPDRTRLRWGLAVGALMAAAFALRVWGVEHGLPYAYNSDENAHFLPRAIGLFGHDWNTGYFINPPAYTYVVHVVLAVFFGGREAVSDQFASDPTSVWVVGRVTAAALGTLALLMLYLAGRRLFDRRTGLLAAGVLAVAFLPVFYSHLALNDVPALFGVCFALWGIAGVLRFGRTRDYALAGVGLGMAAATKYTGGIVLLPLVAAAAVQFSAPGGRAIATRGLALAGGASLATFVALNPYALLDFGAFAEGLSHQSDASGDAAGKLGLTQENGVLYYLWTFGWGLGYVPLAAAVGAIVLLWRDERRLIWVLAPAVVFFVVFMGSQERFFGRWLLPVFPIMCLLAAYCALELADRGGRRSPALRPTLTALAVVALCGQGVVYSLHSGMVLSREDTRNMTRAWMVDNIPEATKIVVEPIAPDLWAQDVGNPSRVVANGNRWVKFPTSLSVVDPETGELLDEPRLVNIEDYERVLRPDLVDEYERTGHCWVVVGSTQRGRAEAEPDKAPGAIAYYRELESRSEVAYEASPYVEGKGPVEFNFDWTFNYFPLDYHRPGPVMTVHRLTGGPCAAA